MRRFFIGMLLSAAAVWLRAETPTITEQPVSLTITNGGTAVFNVAVSGTGPFTYQWRLNETNLSPSVTKVAGAVVRKTPSSPLMYTNSLLARPNDLALDGSGNLFIADRNRICRVDAKGIITTVAGVWSAGFSGDGGAATRARLSSPSCIAVDDGGNLFIADSGNNRIRKVDASGIITTVAGNGTNTYSGDGGPATNAGLGNPQGVALDKAGNLFIIDSLSRRIRKVDIDGIITTVAGGGTGGDGGPATNASLREPRSIAVDDSGNLFIADSGSVRKVDTQGKITRYAGGGHSSFDIVGYPATNAVLNTQDVAVDGLGNLFISDSFKCILKVDNNGIIRRGVDSLTGDRIAVDGSGNLFIGKSEVIGSSILKVNPSWGTTPELVLTNAGAGNAGDYSVVVSTPTGVVTSQVATLAVLMPPTITSQPTNQVVAPGETATFNVSASGEGALSYCWLRDGTPVSGGDGSSYSIPSVQASDSGARFRCLVSNAYGSVTSYVATLSVAIAPTITEQPVSRFVTNGNAVVFSVAVSGMGPLSYQWQVNGTNLSSIITTVAGNGTTTDSGDGGPATNAGLSLYLSGFAVDPAGNLFISGNHRIRKVDASGTITTIAGNGSWGYSGDGGPATSAQLSSVGSIASDGLGNLYFSDQSEGCIRKVDGAGIISTVVGSGSGYMGDGGPATSLVLYDVGAALGGSGDVLLADHHNNLVRKVDASGFISTVAGNGTNGYLGDGGPATSAELNYLKGIAADGAGNVWITDCYNYRVRRVDGNGIITTVAGNGTAGYGGDGGLATSAALNFPRDVAVDGAGNLLIADNYRIRKVDAAGMISTVAGNGIQGSSGDGGPATSASIFPGSVAVDGVGNLYIADVYPARIRKVNYLFGATPTLVLTNVDVAQAGDYSVVVRSPYGCVTSSVVKLSVWGALPPREFSGVVAEEGNVALEFTGGTPGYPYVLLTTTNLTPPVSWEVVGTNLTDGNGGWRMSVSATNADSPARFFRVLGQQP